MYNNDYENYMRSILGYPMPNEVNSYNTYDSNGSYFPYRFNNMSYDNTKEYEDLYPDIYKKIDPIVRNICQNQNGVNLSKDVIEQMTDEIYRNVESDINIVNVNINTVQESDKNQNMQRKEMKVSKSTQNNNDSRKCCANPTLRDLIKILILNNLINNNRPPKPGPRPPFPPRPIYRELENSSNFGNNYNSNFNYNTPYFN